MGIYVGVWSDKFEDSNHGVLEISNKFPDLPLEMKTGRICAIYNLNYHLVVGTEDEHLVDSAYQFFQGLAQEVVSDIEWMLTEEMLLIHFRIVLEDELGIMVTEIEQHALKVEMDLAELKRCELALKLKESSQ